MNSKDDVRDAAEALNIARVLSWAREAAQARWEDAAERTAAAARRAADLARRSLDEIRAGPVIPVKHEWGASLRTDAFMALCEH